MKDYHVTIRRYSPTEERQWTQEYHVPFPEGEEVSVMNVLDYIYRRLDPTLAYFDHAACRQAACGKCLLKLNGEVRLACKERAQEEMLLEPVNANVVKDLLCRI